MIINTDDIGRWIRGWQLGKLFKKLAPELKTAIHVAVTVVEKLKSFVDSPVADILTAIIPTEVDDAIKNILRGALPKILIELKLVEKCSELTDPNEILKCALTTLMQTTGDTRSAFLHDIAVLTAQVIADGKLSFGNSVYLVEHYYQSLGTPAFNTGGEDVSTDE